MDFKCKWAEAVLAALILVFAIWPMMFGSFIGDYANWIIVAAAVLILVHALGCKKCKGTCRLCGGDVNKSESSSEDSSDEGNEKEAVETSKKSAKKVAKKAAKKG